MTANNNNIFEGFEDLDSMMASFIAETEKSAAPVAPKTTAVKAKEQKISADKEKKPKKTMIRVSGVKEFVFGNKTTPISDGTFAKANVSEDDVCAAFAKATESWCSGKAFSAKLVSSAIRIGYTKAVVGDGDAILAPIYGYPVVTPEGDSFDMNGTITVAAIRDRLRELGGVYAKYADPAYGFVQDVDRFYIVPIAGEFEMPFAESVMVAWEGKGVVVTMVTATKATASKDNAEEEDLESEESEAKTEDAKPASLTSAAIRDAFEKKVKGVGNFELALLEALKIAALHQQEIAVAVKAAQDAVEIRAPAVEPVLHRVAQIVLDALGLVLGQLVQIVDDDDAGDRAAVFILNADVVILRHIHPVGDAHEDTARILLLLVAADERPVEPVFASVDFQQRRVERLPLQKPAAGKLRHELGNACIEPGAGLAAHFEKLVVSPDDA